MSWRKDRRSVRYDGLPWVGFYNNSGLGMMDLLKKAPTEEHAKYLTVAFCTGCRESELISLKPEQFVYNDESVVGTNVMVLKYHKYVRGANSQRIVNYDPASKNKFVTEPVRMTRFVRIKRDDKNALAENFVNIIDNCDTDYLLPGRNKFSSEAVADKQTSRMEVYRKINGIDKRVWPHWVRSQTVAYLIEELKLDAYAIKSWFAWSSLEMSDEYFKRSGVELGRLMGVSRWAT